MNVYCMRAHCHKHYACNIGDESMLERVMVSIFHSWVVSPRESGLGTGKKGKEGTRGFTTHGSDN